MKRVNYIFKTKDLYVIPNTGNIKEGDTVWDVPYDICLYERGKVTDRIGGLSFHSKPVLGVVTLSMGIDERYRNRGYGRQVLKDVVQWAFNQKDVYEIRIDIPKEREAALHLVMKTPFVFRSKDECAEHYSVIKPKTTWLGLYVVLGLFAGCLLGILTGSFVVGIPLGIVIGILIGSIMDVSAGKKRKSVTG